MNKENKESPFVQYPIRKDEICEKYEHRIKDLEEKMEKISDIVSAMELKRYKKGFIFYIKDENLDQILFPWWI